MHVVEGLVFLVPAVYQDYRTRARGKQLDTLDVVCCIVSGVAFFDVLLSMTPHARHCISSICAPTPAITAAQVSAVSLDRYPSTHHSLNFGITNMTINNATHATPILAHSPNRANHPLPSVIFRNDPIRLSADSMPPTFLSSADVALSTSGFDDSRAVEKDCVDLFRARARSRSEVVRSS